MSLEPPVLIKNISNLLQQLQYILSSDISLSKLFTESDSVPNELSLANNSGKCCIPRIAIQNEGTRREKSGQSKSNDRNKSNTKSCCTDLRYDVQIDKLSHDLTASRSLIDDLSLEIADLKRDRAQLRGDLENKSLNLQKLELENRQKDSKITLFREFFDKFIDPDFAADFASQVAYRHRSCSLSSSASSAKRMKMGNSVSNSLSRMMSQENEANITCPLPMIDSKQNNQYHQEQCERSPLKDRKQLCVPYTSSSEIIHGNMSAFANSSEKSRLDFTQSSISQYKENLPVSFSSLRDRLHPDLNNCSRTGCVSTVGSTEFFDMKTIKPTPSRRHRFVDSTVISPPLSNLNEIRASWETVQSRIPFIRPPFEQERPSALSSSTRTLRKQAEPSTINLKSTEPNESSQCQTS